MVSLNRSPKPSSCRTSWDDMDGTPKVRYCESCKQHVYNAAAMSESELEAAVEKFEGEGLVTLHTRFDGMVVAGECKSRLGAIKNHVAGATAIAAGVLLGLVAGSLQTPVVGVRRASAPTAQRWLIPAATDAAGSAPSRHTMHFHRHRRHQAHTTQKASPASELVSREVQA